MQNRASELNLKTLLLFIFALWLVFASLAYYSLLPFTGLLRSLPSLAGMRFPFEPLTHLFFLLLFVLSIGGWGSLFFAGIPMTDLERFLFASGAGLGVWCLAVFLSGISGLIFFPAYAVLLIAGIVIFVLKRHAFRRPPRLLPFLAVAALPLAGTLIGALAPPTQYDSLVYHLAFPARYILSGRFLAVPDSIFSSFPQNLEMLFQGAMVLDGDILANLISWLFLPLSALAIYSFVLRYARRGEALTAAGIWLFTPAVMFLATGTYVDLGLAFFVFLGFYAFFLWKENGGGFWLAWAGIFAGLALGTKYTGGAAAVILFVLILFSGKKPRGTIKDATLFAAVTLAVFLPWLVKNAALFNDPVSPWGTLVFGRSSLSPETAAGYLAHIRHHGVPITALKDVLLLPWQMTAYGYRFGGGFDIPGPVFLLFLPALFFLRKIDKITKALLLVTFAFFAIWLVSGKVLRFLMPAAPFIAILAARGFHSLLEERRLRGIAWWLLLLAFAHNLLMFHWTMAPVDPYAPVISGEARGRYLTRKVNYYQGVSEAVNRVPPGETVMFYGEPRSYYAARPVIAPSVFDPHPFIVWANRASTPAELKDTLMGRNVTYLFVNEHELQRLGTARSLSPQGNANVTGLLKDSADISYRDKYCTLYRIKN